MNEPADFNDPLEAPAPMTPTERAVRDAMLRSTEPVPQALDLMTRAQLAADRIRHRRTRRVAAAAVAITVLAIGGGAAAMRDRTAGRSPVGGTTTAATAPSSVATVAASAAQSGPPASGPAASGPAASPRNTAPPTGASSAGQPQGPWGHPQLDEHFTGTALDTSRWTLYTGTSSGSAATVFAPAAVTLPGGGGMRITVERTGQSAPSVRSGGIKVAGAGTRYGRWEVTWRMTAANGVTADFLFLGEGPGGIGQVATLVPAERRMTVSDKVKGTSTDVTLDVSGYHTVAVESTPQRVRWLLDEKVVVDEPGGAPSAAVIPAVQALVAGEDCATTPLPASCTGPASYPQYLDVASIRYWPYQG